MSFTYGSVIAFLLIPTIGTFLFGLLFWGKLKVIRYVFWFISGVFLLFTISTVITHSNHNSKESKKLLGVYKLDLTKSKYKNDTLTKFADLTLTVKDNDKFYFSKKTPLFSATSGEWDFEDDGDLIITECTFDDTNKHFQILDGIGTWTFQSHCLTNGSGEDAIVFSRIEK
jgi:hypothetical protein